MPVITIRGHLGSYADEIAQEVAGLLEYPCIDHASLMEQVAEFLEVPPEECAELERVSTTIWGGISSALFKAYSRVPVVSPIGIPHVWMPPTAYVQLNERSLNEKTYLETVTRVVKDIASTGHLVMLGKGTQVILRGFERAFHVFVTAPLHVRARRIMDMHRCDERAARRLIAQTDGARRLYLRKYFSAHLEDPDLYDLVINTGRVSSQTAANTIARTALEASG